MKEGNPRTIHLEDYAPPDFLIDRVRLRFELGETSTTVHSSLAVRRNPAVEAGEGLKLDGVGLQLERLTVDGRELTASEYLVDDESLIIPIVPDRFELECTTRIKPQDNTTLEGLYKSSGNFCTQCEAEGFRKITYYPDRPDVMAQFATTIIADRDRYPVLLSNGNPTGTELLPGNRHAITWEDPWPKPAYLFALIAGDLLAREDEFVTVSGRKVALRIYVQPHNLDKTAHAMASLKRSMRWDEERFGLEYDLDIFMIVAVDDFNMGAMENKGLNVFNSKYVLADPASATDTDYENIESIIAHEYFHNWTGNRVTCRDWFQLSLKEGLTVFRDQEFSADMISPAGKRIDDVGRLRTHQFAEDAGPMAHPVRPQSYMEINNFYTATVYEKGAEVVRMYQTLFGREGFREGMALYFQRHDGEAVTTDDFAGAMADANGADLTQFKRWYDQAGTPRLDAMGEWDAVARTYELTLRQHCPPTPQQTRKEPFVVPCEVGLLDESGADMPLQLQGETAPHGLSRVLELRDEVHRFTFVNVSVKPVPSLLRAFSAPVLVNFDYSDEDLAFLLAHDSDAFNRWEAGQQLALRILRRLTAEYLAKRPLQLDAVFVAALRDTLEGAGLDGTLVSATLTLPPERYLVSLFDTVDVDAVHSVREFVRRKLARSMEAQLLTCYEAGASGGEYVYSAAEIGRRRLRNLCLSMLNLLDSESYRELALEQYIDANNMTDSLGALNALIDHECAQRDEVLSLFHNRWRSDTLVMDKWFAIQASSSRADTLSVVKTLMDHPLFEMTNPNKVRALIGAFAHDNPVNFHQVSGTGYAFVAEQVLQLDTLNPQVAARLVQAFSQWRKYDAVRQQLMRAELERIAGTESTSSDVYEVVSKTLA